VDTASLPWLRRGGRQRAATNPRAVELNLRRLIDLGVTADHKDRSLRLA
jgi:hypothetical protein